MGTTLFYFSGASCEYTIQNSDFDNFYANFNTASRASANAINVLNGNQLTIDSCEFSYFLTTINSYENFLSVAASNSAFVLQLYSNIIYC